MYDTILKCRRTHNDADNKILVVRKKINGIIINRNTNVVKVLKEYCKTNALYGIGDILRSPYGTIISVETVNAYLGLSDNILIMYTGKSYKKTRYGVTRLEKVKLDITLVEDGLVKI